MPQPSARAIADPAVRAAFDAFPKAVRADLLRLRALIYETAATTPGVGPLEETLKWGQPAYLTTQTNAGSAIRIGVPRGSADRYALYVLCRTTLADEFRRLYPRTLRIEGSRAVLFEVAAAPPREALAHCIALALTYRLRARRAGATLRPRP
jgi:hypothetical protein